MLLLLIAGALVFFSLEWVPADVAYYTPRRCAIFVRGSDEQRRRLLVDPRNLRRREGDDPLPPHWREP